jgi:hypothetical protein
MKTRRLSFGGSYIAIEYEDEQACRIVDRLCQYISQAEDSDSPHVRFRLLGNRSKNGFQLFMNGELAWETGSAMEMMVFLLDSVAYQMADRCKEGLLLHAASLAFQGRGILFPGASGCGKTSLAAWLILQGFDYLSDELSFIPSGTTEIQGLSRPLCMKDGGWKKINGLILSDPDLDRDARTEGRIVLSPEKIGPCRILNAATLQVIVFPNFHPSVGMTCLPVSRAQTGLALMTCLPNARNLPGHGFPEVADIARRIPAFRLTYATFDGISDTIKTLMHSV